MAKKVTRTVEKKKEGGVKSKKVTYKTKSGTTVTRTKSKGGGTGKRKSTTVTNKAGKTVATSTKAKRVGERAKFGVAATPSKRKKKTVTSGNTTVTTRKQAGGAVGKQGQRTVKKNGKVVRKKTKTNVRPGDRLQRAATTGIMVAGAPGAGAIGAIGAAGAVGFDAVLRRGTSGKTKTKNGKVVKNKRKGTGNVRFRDVPLPKSNF